MRAFNQAPRMIRLHSRSAFTFAEMMGYKLGKDLPPGFAVAADINPGTSNATGTCNVLLPNISSSAEQMRQANSPNHDGQGQNILFADGHVDFDNNPFVGINNDNIYTAGGSAWGDSRQELVASLAAPNDSVLLPTAENQ